MAARGAAWRRRQRRLRSMPRHERQTVRMELAAAFHHSWGGGPGTHEGLRAQKTASAGPAEYFELSSDDGRPAGRERPAALLEPRPQERDRRHTGVGYEIAQNLVVPVPQMGEQLPDVLQFFASFLPVVAEQVIEVPKIFLDMTPQRLGDHLRQPQRNSWCMCRLSCLIRRSSSLLPSRSSTFQFRVETEEGGVEVFKVLSQDRIQQHCTLSRPLTFQFLVVLGKGGVEVFKVLLDRVQQPLHLTLVLVMALGKGFFRTFPGRKKVRSKVRTRGRKWVRTLIHPR